MMREECMLGEKQEQEQEAEEEWAGCIPGGMAAAAN
jgi:hypothetical protein